MISFYSGICYLMLSYVLYCLKRISLFWCSSTLFLSAWHETLMPLSSIAWGHGSPDAEVSIPEPCRLQRRLGRRWHPNPVAGVVALAVFLRTLPWCVPCVSRSPVVSLDIFLPIRFIIVSSVARQQIIETIEISIPLRGRMKKWIESSPNYESFCGEASYYGSLWLVFG